MLEFFRNLAKIVVGIWLGTGGLLLLLAGIGSLLSLYDLFVLGDFNLFLTHLAFVFIIGALIFCIFWMGHDAASELKSIQTQKEELKELEAKEGKIPDVPTKEPWLYP